MLKNKMFFQCEIKLTGAVHFYCCSDFLLACRCSGVCLKVGSHNRTMSKFCLFTQLVERPIINFIIIGLLRVRDEHKVMQTCGVG